MNFGILEATVDRAKYGIFVVFMDFIMICIFAYFIWYLDISQQKFAKTFKAETIQMNTFTVRIAELPLNKEYGDNEHVLKAHLWKLVEDGLIEQYKKENKGEEPEEGEKMIEIVDIQLANTEFKGLKELNDYAAQMTARKPY